MKQDSDKRTLVVKFLAGEISDSEMNVLKAWLEKDPANRQVFNEENELWQESGIKTQLDHYQIENAWTKVSDKIRAGRNRDSKVIVLNRNNYRILIAAASVACMVAIVGLTLRFAEKGSDKHNIAALTTVCTEEGEKAHILLADSTNVYINSGSTLEYKADYNTKERVVRLSGEAFFDVRTNPEKPFVVQLDQLTVSATGTRFNVLSYSNENRIETTLEEGKIQISIIGQEPLEVKSGQQVVYFTKTKKAVVSDVHTETYTSWKENKLRFNDTPFEEALRKISRKYNVTFQIQNRELLDLKYTATFIDESIEEVMQMLKVVSPITYKINYRTTISDQKYMKPQIVVGKRKTT